jgi:thioredoxin-dependent peroxiredoxin
MPPLPTTPRKPAPAFTAPSSQGRPISLSDFRGKYLVLYFYPRSFTLGCTRETIGFRDASARLRALGAEVVGVSPDTLDVQCKFADHYQTVFAILSDESASISRDYGVMFPILPRVKRVTFVIDPEGYIVARFHHELLIDKHISDVLAFLEAHAGQ